jgi:hypothetical protein
MVHQYCASQPAKLDTAFQKIYHIGSTRLGDVVERTQASALYSPTGVPVVVGFNSAM